MARWGLEARKRGSKTVYYARLQERNPDGTYLTSARIRLETVTKTDSRAVVAAMNAKVQSGSLGIPIQGQTRDVPLVAAIEARIEQLETHRSAGWARISGYILRGRVAEFFGSAAMVSAITDTAVSRYQTWRRGHRNRYDKSLDPGTINREVAAIRGLLKFSIRHYGLSHLKLLTVADIPERKKQIRFLTGDEVHLFLSVAESTNKLIHAYSALAYYAGLRNGSIMAMKWGDIHYMPECRSSKFLS